MALNVLYGKKEKIYPAYISTQIVKNKLSFNDLKWRKMALSCSKKLSALLRGITFKHHDDFYYLNCLHSFATEKNLNHIRKSVKI